MGKRLVGDFGILCSGLPKFKWTILLASTAIFLLWASVAVYSDEPDQGKPRITETLLADGTTQLRISRDSGKGPLLYHLDLTKDYSPAASQTPEIKQWENYKFGAFLCFNTNQFSGNEFCSLTDPMQYNPTHLNVRKWVKTIKQLGMKYAVLTVRHTSGFLLYDSPTTNFDVASSGNKTDVVRDFVDSCRKEKIAPCLYYCLWGGDFNPDPKARETILAQLYELSSNYGKIACFWIDMNIWGPKDLPAQTIYNALKSRQPESIVIFNQGVLDASRIQTFPTDVLNGEITLPPESKHQKVRQWNGKPFYLPFEFAAVSQLRDYSSVASTPYGMGAWFTYGEGKSFPPSRPISAKDLKEWIQSAYKRGASNVLLSIAPDYTGSMRDGDVKVLSELASMLQTPKSPCWVSAYTQEIKRKVLF